MQQVGSNCRILPSNVICGIYILFFASEFSVLHPQTNFRNGILINGIYTVVWLCKWLCKFCSAPGSLAEATEKSHQTSWKLCSLSVILFKHPSLMKPIHYYVYVPFGPYLDFSPSMHLSISISISISVSLSSPPMLLLVLTLTYDSVSLVCLDLSWSARLPTSGTSPWRRRGL